MVVNLTYNPREALQGVLWSSRGGWITLRDAFGLAAGKDPARIDGDVIIHVRNVAYFQVVGTTIDVDRIGP